MKLKKVQASSIKSFEGVPALHLWIALISKAACYMHNVWSLQWLEFVSYFDYVYRTICHIAFRHACWYLNDMQENSENKNTFKNTFEFSVLVILHHLCEFPITKKLNRKVFVRLKKYKVLLDLFLSLYAI